MSVVNFVHLRIENHVHNHYTWKSVMEYDIKNLIIFWKARNFDFRSPHLFETKISFSAEIPKSNYSGCRSDIDHLFLSLCSTPIRSHRHAQKPNFNWQDSAHICAAECQKTIGACIYLKHVRWIQHSLLNAIQSHWVVDGELTHWNYQQWNTTLEWLTSWLIDRLTYCLG